MGASSYQLATHFSANCQLTTNSSSGTINFHFTAKNIASSPEFSLPQHANISFGGRTYTKTKV